MIEHVRGAETNLRHLRGQLEALLSGSTRVCTVCGTAVTGRAVGSTAERPVGSALGVPEWEQNEPARLLRGPTPA